MHMLKNHFRTWASRPHNLGCKKIVESQNHHDYRDFGHALWFLAIAVLLCHTDFQWIMYKTAQCSFSDANLALQLMATFNAMRLRLRLVYKLTQLKFIFLQFDNFFSYFRSILIPYEYSGHGTTVLYYFIDMHYGSQTVTREATVNTECHGFTTVFHFSSRKLPRFCGFFTVIFLQPYLHYMH